MQYQIEINSQLRKQLDEAYRKLDDVRALIEEVEADIVAMDLNDETHQYLYDELGDWQAKIYALDCDIAPYVTVNIFDPIK